MSETTKIICPDCRWAQRGPEVRGKVFYRCWNPDGRLGDPQGRGTRSTAGYVVDRPIDARSDPRLRLTKPPGWCPRLSGE